MNRKPLILIVVMLLTFTGTGFGQGSEAAPEMPPMGPPEEMKSLAWLEGNWDVAMRALLDYTKTDEWSDMTARCTYHYAVGSAAMMFDYTSDFGGMQFVGMGCQTFDRETGKWQVTWVDNMGARTSMYTGENTGDSLTIAGEDMYAGVSTKSRITTVKKSEDEFEWRLEQSFDGGKSWIPTGTAVYTRVKK